MDQSLFPQSHDRLLEGLCRIFDIAVGMGRGEHTSGRTHVVDAVITEAPLVHLDQSRRHPLQPFGVGRIKILP